MLLSIVILNYKVPLLVEQCLHSVWASIQGIETEVWVVDNDSQDGSVDYLQKRFPWVRFIANSQNVGFARGNNIALKQARGKYSLLLNPDTVLTPIALQNCVAFMEQNSQAGAVGVKMLNARGAFLPESKRGYPTPWVAFCKMSGLGSCFPHSKLFNRYYLGHASHREVHQVDVLTGAFMFMRTEALERSGFLDEEYFMYGEDIDLSYKIALCGYKLYYLPIPILHYKGESERAAANRSGYVDSFYGAMDLFYRKHLQKRYPLLTPFILGAIKFKKNLEKRKWRKQQSAATTQPIPDRRVEPIEVAVPWSVNAMTSYPSGSHLLLVLEESNYAEALNLMEELASKQFYFHLHTAASGKTISPPVV